MPRAFPRTLLAAGRAEAHITVLNRTEVRDLLHRLERRGEKSATAHCLARKP